MEAGKSEELQTSLYYWKSEELLKQVWKAKDIYSCYNSNLCMEAGKEIPFFCYINTLKHIFFCKTLIPLQVPFFTLLAQITHMPL